MADVELTEILGEKIEMLNRCDLQRLYNRVKEIPLQGSKVGTYGFSNRLKKYLFPRAMSQVAVLARIFGECREGRIPRSSAAQQA